MRISTMAAALAAAAVLLVPLAGIASAQDRDCPDFASQAEAQAALDASTGDPERLDADNDGKACESHFGGPVAAPPTQVTEVIEEPALPDPTSEVVTPIQQQNVVLADRDCPDFAGPAEAQAALDAGVGDPERLDADNDGIACEDHFGERVAATSTEVSATTPPVTTPIAARNAALADRDCPDFASQSEAQAALDASADDPERLDRDGDGIACEDQFGEQAMTSPDDGDADDSATTANSSDAGRQVTIVPRGAVDTGDGSTSY